MDNINVSELFTTKMCSPLIAFAVITLLLGVSLYNSRTALKSHNSSRMDNLLNVYSWHEIKLIIKDMFPNLNFYDTNILLVLTSFLIEKIISRVVISLSKLKVVIRNLFFLLF